MCESQSCNTLFTTLSKYKQFKCVDCANVYEYNIKFRNIELELTFYFEASKMYLNWLILTYLEKLLFSAGFFIDRWIVDKHPFDDAAEIGFKEDVIACIKAYATQYANLVGFAAQSDNDVVPLTTNLAVETIKNISDESIIMAMILKYDYEPCDKNGYWFKDCCMKHSHLKKTFEDRLNFNKSRRANKKNKRAKKKKKEKKEKEVKKKKAKEKKEETYGAVGVFASHSVFAAIAFFKLVAALPSNRFSVGASANTTANVIAFDFVIFWLLDIGAFYHMIGNRSVFTFFTPMSSQIVSGIDGDLKAERYGSVRLFCKEGRSLTINNVLYVKNCPYNLFSFNQLHNDGCFLSIIKNGFSIGVNNIQVLLRCDLYFVQLEDLVVCVSVNFDILRMWHERLGHLGNQNIIKLAHSVSIDLSKSFFSDSCLSCDKRAGKIESHKNYIVSKRHQADLIHKDLMNSFSVRGYNDATWIAAWLDDKIKQFHVNTLLSKKGSEVLTSFKFFLGRIEHNMNRYTRIRIDNGKKYLNEGFMEYIAERDIRFEPTTAGNSQINGCVERFNQIIMRKVNTFLKDNDIVFK